MTIIIFKNKSARRSEFSDRLIFISIDDLLIGIIAVNRIKIGFPRGNIKVMADIKL